MPNRKPRQSDFVGKTIATVNTEACNVWTFCFTDGTSIAIEAEVYYPGLPVMEVCEECVQECPTPNKKAVKWRSQRRSQPNTPQNRKRTPSQGGARSSKSRARGGANA